MPVYKVTDTSGKVRVVEAPLQKSALNHVVRADYIIQPLSATQLSKLMRENPELQIEEVVSAVKDEDQSDLEDATKPDANDEEDDE